VAIVHEVSRGENEPNINTGCNSSHSSSGRWRTAERPGLSRANSRGHGALDPASFSQAFHAGAMPGLGSVLVVNSFECREMDAAFLPARTTHVDVAQLADALAQLDTAQPDVVVTDTVFRGTDVDGAGVIRELRRRLEGETSIIVVSERARREDREQARAAGADCYLLKPVLPN